MPLDENIQEKLDNNINNNLNVITLHKYNPDFFKYKKYDPFTSNTNLIY